MEWGNGVKKCVKMRKNVKFCNSENLVNVDTTGGRGEFESLRVH